MDLTTEQMFATYRAVLDQLPQAGFYVVFMQDGNSMLMPIKAVDTVEEARAIPERPKHIKNILNGKKPYRLWSLVDDKVMLVDQYSTREEMMLRKLTFTMPLHVNCP